MCCIFRGEQREIASVETNPIQMDEIRIAPFFPAYAEEIEQAILFVDTQKLSDVSFPRCNFILELACLQIIEIEMPPVVALREPKDFIRRREIAPIGKIVSRFEFGR